MAICKGFSVAICKRFSLKTNSAVYGAASGPGPRAPCVRTPCVHRACVRAPCVHRARRACNVRAYTVRTPCAHRACTARARTRTVRALTVHACVHRACTVRQHCGDAAFSIQRSEHSIQWRISLFPLYCVCCAEEKFGARSAPKNFAKITPKITENRTPIVQSLAAPKCPLRRRFHSGPPTHRSVRGGLDR